MNGLQEMIRIFELLIQPAGADKGRMVMCIAVQNLQAQYNESIPGRLTGQASR